MTVAIYLAQKGIVPPKQWYHSRYLWDTNQNTVQDYLVENNIQVPDEWKCDENIIDLLYNFCNKTNLNVNQVVLNPGFRNDDYKTFAMVLIKNMIIPKDEWLHDPQLQDYEGNTVAMYFAVQNMFPPKEWYHDPLIKNNYGFTVAMILAQRGMVPPDQWMHDIDEIKNNDGDSMRTFLNQHQYLKDEDGQKYHNCQTEFLNGVCIICLQEREQEFIKTTCGHKLCLKCFINMQNLLNGCPICKRKDWFYTYIDQKQEYIHEMEQKEFETEEQENIKKILSDNLTKQIQYKLKDYCKNYNIKDVNIIKNNSQWNKNEAKITFPIYLAKQGIIPSNQFIHDPSLQDIDGNTVAHYLAQYGTLPPKEWQINKFIINNQEQTVYNLLQQYYQNQQKDWEYDQRIIEKLNEYCNKYEIENMRKIIDNPSWNENIDKLTFPMYLAQNKIIPPKEFLHETKLKDNKGNTVAMYLAQNKIQPSQDWNHDPLLQNNDGYTVAMLLALNNIEIQEQWYHIPGLINNEGYNVQDYLLFRQQNIPEQWRFNGIDFQKKVIQLHLKEYCRTYQINDMNIIIQQPQYNSNKDKCTFAMFLATFGIIPPKEYKHDSELQNAKGQTVAEILINKNIVPSKDWVDNTYKKYNNGQTMAMKIAQIKEELPEWWQHTNTLQDNFGNTVAHYFAKNGIIPPEYWQHNKFLVNNEGYTVQDYLLQNERDVPEQWSYDQILMDKLNEYCNYYRVENINIIINNPQYNVNNDNVTFAMYLVNNNLIPPKEFQHNKYLQDSNGNTVSDLLIEKQIQVPEYWKIDNSQQLQEYCDIANISSQKIKRNPDSQNNSDKTTFAMFLAYNNIIPQKQWHHDPKLQESVNNQTVAMILADKGIIPPKIWQHNLQMQDKDGNTVGMLLAKHGIIPPKYWLHDNFLKNNKGETIKSCLNNCIVIYDEYNQQHYIYETFNDNDTCSICIETKFQEFIKTKCGDKICVNCFKEILKFQQFQQYKYCPICKERDWCYKNQYNP